MIEEHSNNSRTGIEYARFGVVPNDAVLDELIEKYFASVPDWQQENDIMPICTIISAWTLAHITLYEALPMARLEAVCEGNYVDATAVLHRISHNHSIAFISKGDADRLVMNGKIQKGSHPIIVPDTILDASMNYEERAHYLIDAFGLDRPINLHRKPLFCDPSNDELSDYYLSKVDPHQDVSLNVCWVSLAVFYASPKKRTQIRGLAVVVLDELYHSMCNSKGDFNRNFNDDFQTPIFTRNFGHFTEPPSSDSKKFKRGRDYDRDQDGDSSFGDFLQEDS